MGANDMTTEPMRERPTVPDADSPQEVEHENPHDDGDGPGNSDFGHEQGQGQGQGNQGQGKPPESTTKPVEPDEPEATPRSDG